MSKKIFIFVFLVVLGTGFLAVNFVLAVDDNVNDSACIGGGSPNYEESCDDKSEICEDLASYDWAENGYSGSYGYSGCCGDDSDEYYSDGSYNQNIEGCCWRGGQYFMSCHTADNGSKCLNGSINDSSDFACTYSNSVCVYNGSQYTSGQTRDTDDLSSDVEVCRPQIDNWMGWVDQDSSVSYGSAGTGSLITSGYCNFDPIRASECDDAGPDGDCDDAYSGSGANYGACCGDDSNENYVSQDCAGGSVSLCCPDNKPYVSDGSCVAFCPLPDLKNSDSYFSLDPSDACFTGSSVTINNDVLNIGEGSTSFETVTVYYQVFRNGAEVFQDHKLYYESIPANDSLRVSNSFGSGVFASAGSYVIAVTLDSADEEAESNESNNVKYLTFVCEDPNLPPTVSLLSPANNASCQNTSLTLSWNGSDPNDDSLTYYIYTCAGLGCAPNNLEGSTTNESYNLSGLSAGLNYGWRVRAWDGLEEGWSSTWRFFTSSNCSADDGWYDVGGAESCCDNNELCSTCQDQEYRNYYCSGLGCSYNITDTRTNKSSCACSFGACNADCDYSGDCTDTTQCNGDIYQTRSPSCASSCSCNYGSWSNSTCEQSYNNCSAECWTGSNCNTSTSSCSCDSGYYSDGAGGCTAGNAPPNKPTSLSQSPGSEGSWTNDDTPYFDFIISDPNPGDRVGYQILIDNNSSFSSPTISYNWSGSTTNPNPVNYQVPSGSELSDGIYYWRVRAKDLAGLYSDWADNSNGFDYSGIDFRVDTTNPVCGTVSYDPSTWTNGNVTVTIQCSDSGSGCAQNPYQTTRSANGSGSLTIYDNAGNSNSCSYNVTNIDKTDPSVSNATAYCDSYSDTCETDDDTQIYFTWDVSDSGGSGLDYCRAEIGDSSPDEDAGLDGQDIDTGSAGTNTYYVKCCDTAGNCANDSDTIDINLDPDAPTITFNPTSRDWDNSNVNVTVTASDDSGITYTRHCWTTFSSCDPGTASSSTFENGSSITQNSNGNWNLCIRARDGTGNWNSSPICSGRYSIDKTDPEVDSYSVNTKTEDFSTEDTSLEIRWSVSDTGGSGLDQVEVWYRKDADSWDEITDCQDTSVSGSSANNSSNPCVHNVVCGSNYEYGIHVKDEANNEVDEGGSGLETITAVINCISESDFSIGRSPSSRAVDEGQDGNYTITLTSINDFSDTVDLTAINCPSGADCSFSPSSLVPTNDSVLNISNASVGGPYTITVRGIGGGKTHETTVSLTVSEAGGGDNTPPDDPTNLQQFDDVGEITEGAESNDSTPYFSFDISDSDSGDILGYQIQVDTSDNFVSPDIDFTWDGSTTNPNSVTYQVPSESELNDANYYWQVRAKDGDGAYSNWVMFGASAVDFNIDTAVSGAPTAEFSACRIADNTILFIDESTDSDGDVESWDWDFDDATSHSSLQNPRHNYDTGATSLIDGKTKVAGDKTERKEELKKSILKSILEFIKNLPKKIISLISSEKSLAYNSSWQQNKIVLVTYSGTALTDYAVQVNVDYLSGMQSDFDDIRFVDSDNTTDLNHWRQEYVSGTSAIFWIKIPAIPDDGKEIYMYFDNDSESSASNGSNTFLWFDDFESYTTGSVIGQGDWIEYSGNDPFLVSTDDPHNGTKSLKSDNVESYVRISSQNFGRGVLVGYTMKMTNKGNDTKADYFFQPKDLGESWDRIGHRGLYSVNNFYDTIKYVSEDTGVLLALNTWYNIEMGYFSNGQVDTWINDVQIKNDAETRVNDLDYFILGNDESDRGYFDDIFVTPFKHDGPTAMVVDTYGVTLIAEDDDSKTDSETKILNLDAMTLSGTAIEDCDFSFDFTNLSSSSCDLASGEWDLSLIYDSAGDYSVYRCTSNCTSFANYSSISPTKSCSVLGCGFDDATADSNTTYYYLVSNPDSLNNSTLSPSCDGGEQSAGTICPLSVTTPICQPQNILTSHLCGSIALDWLEDDNISYKINRCVGKESGSDCTPSDLLYEFYSADCSDGRCVYTDEEIIPTNLATPIDENYYCYGIIGVDGEGLESSISETICDYSYCYRAPNWQEQ